MPHQSLPLLNPEQRKAVNTHSGPLLIIAGAGSGKTRVITFRIANMLKRGIDEKNILAVTFTNKAAAEMRHRVRELTGTKLKHLTIATFHAFGLKILRECHQQAGYKPAFTVYDETDREALIKEIAHDLKIDLKTMSLYAIASLFSRIKTGQRDWQDRDSAYRPLYEEYNDHLKIYHAVDFDDLITLPIELFVNHPETLIRYQERFRYIMVDEFQDTSDIQYRFITMIARTHRNICVVGDDDQSIYSFRGARFENLLRFETDFPGVVEIKLEQNYRSTKTILDAANRLITANAARKNKALWSENAQGEPITLALPKTEREEGDFIATEIRSLAQTRGIPYAEIGILVRTNHLTRAIEEALLAHKIPYAVSGGLSFFNRKEVKDILSYLRVIANPDDDINLLRIINTPRRGIGKGALLELTDLGCRHSCSLFSSMALVSAGQAYQFAKKVKTEIDEFVNLAGIYQDKFRVKKGLATALRDLVDRIDYRGYLVQQNKNEQAVRYKNMNVESIINSIADYENDPDNHSPSLIDYLNRVTLASMEENKDDDQTDKVNLMTVHAAKGLEFEAVFVAALENGLFPHSRSIEENEANIEEERRLFYVALTRAKSKLYLSAAATRRRMGEELESSPSPFLEELPQELLVHHQEQAVEAESASDYFKRMKTRFT